MLQNWVDDSDIDVYVRRLTFQHEYHRVCVSYYRQVRNESGVSCYLNSCTDVLLIVKLAVVHYNNLLPVTRHCYVIP